MGIRNSQRSVLFFVVSLGEQFSYFHLVSSRKSRNFDSDYLHFAKEKKRNEKKKNTLEIINVKRKLFFSFRFRLIVVFSIQSVRY